MVSHWKAPNKRCRENSRKEDASQAGGGKFSILGIRVVRRLIAWMNQTRGRLLWNAIIVRHPIIYLHVVAINNSRREIEDIHQDKI